MMLNAFKLGSKYPVFTKQIEAKKDVVSSKWMIPAYATDVELIAKKDGYQRYFKEGAWHYVVDNIGTEYWDEDGTKHTITELGEEVPEGALLEEPVIPPVFEQQAASAEAECTKRISSQWNSVGQINASLGIYSDAEIESCKRWISDHRSALADLLAMDDLVELDVTDDQYWPS